jgi:hypothetical protein
LVPYVHQPVKEAVDFYATVLTVNGTWKVAKPLKATCDDAAYDIILPTSAFQVMESRAKCQSRDEQRRSPTAIQMPGVRQMRGCMPPCCYSSTSLPGTQGKRAARR